MTEHIEQAHWEAFFNDLAKKHHGFDARMEVMSRTFGDQEVATWLPFSGISMIRIITRSSLPSEASAAITPST